MNRTSTGHLPWRRWAIAWLLALGVLVNYFDRVNLSVSHAALYETFGISTVTFGYLSAAYNWTYALCQLPVGVMLDRFGVRRIGIWGAVLWAVASFTAAATPGLRVFFAARLLLGVGEAPSFPANAKAIAAWFAAGERSFATSLFDSSAKFASAIGVPLLGFALIKVGWRWTFAITGFASLAYVALFWRIYHDPRQEPHSVDLARPLPDDAALRAKTRNAGLLRLGYLLRRRKVLGLALGFGSYNYVFYLLLTWLPSYLSSALHVDLLRSFLYTGLPWLFATFTDLAVGGWLVDALIRKGYDAHRVRKIVLVCGTSCGLGILGAAEAHSASSALLWISLSIGGLAAAAPVGWSIPSLIVPLESVGRVGGIVNFSNQLSGIAAGIVTGYLVAAHNGSFAWAFAVAAAYLVIGIAAYICLLGRIELIPLASAS